MIPTEQTIADVFPEEEEEGMINLQITIDGDRRFQISNNRCKTSIHFEKF